MSNAFLTTSTIYRLFISLVRAENPNTKIFMVGHSMGSTIAIDYALEHQRELQGLIISGTTLKAGASISKAAITGSQYSFRPHAQNRGIRA